jgi:hypothetical protein
MGSVNLLDNCVLRFAAAQGGTALHALDFANLNGQFGTIYENINFKGAGGVGAREGFAFTLTLIPTVMLALGFINVADSLGALKGGREAL